MTRPNGYARLHELVAIVAFIGVAAGLLQLSGCNAKGTIAGRVNFKGKPLPSGLVVFVDRDDNRYPALIQRDGSYTMANMPCGPMKIIVGTAPTRNLVHPVPSSPFVPYVQIPRHYADPDKSGLMLDVRRGLQVFRIDLKDDFEPGETVGGFD